MSGFVEKREGVWRVWVVLAATQSDAFTSDCVWSSELCLLKRESVDTR